MRNENYYSFKRQFMSFLVMFLFFAGSSFASNEDNLILHYTFDNDSGTEIADVSVNHFNGLLMGEAGTFVDGGKFGKALHLPTVNTPALDYVTLPEGIVSNLTDFTVATWVKLDNLKMWARIFDFGMGENTNMFLTVHGGTSVPRFAITVGGTASEEIINAGRPLPIGEWVHIAVSVNYSTGVGSIYINGAKSGADKENCTLPPSSMGVTTANYLGKAQYNDPGFNGYIDDFRIYNKAFERNDIMELLGIDQAVVAAFDAFDMSSILAPKESLNEVYSDLTLPTSVGEVTLTWTSSNTAAVSNTGQVTSQSIPGLATLTVTFSKAGSESMSKSVDIIVAPEEPLPALVAKWTFESENISTKNGETVILSDDETEGTRYEATVKDVAQIRTIGGDNNGYYNVLDLGNNKGHLDLGTEIGKAVYQLTNYSVGGYFRVAEDSPQYTANGNFLLSFSNTLDGASDPTGYLFMRPYASVLSISTHRWDNGEQHTSLDAHFSGGANSYLGTWHHMFYVQEGTTGTMYIDGEQVAQNTNMTLLPVGIAQPGFEGTPYNWLGRACFASDSYLRNTLIYDFRLYSLQLSADDMENELNVTATLESLNAAYDENSNVEDTELTEAQAALDLGDLTNVTANLTLPSKVPGYNNVSVTWSSYDDYIIATDGTVKRPAFYDATIKLTAELMKNGKKVTKDFMVTVKTNGTPHEGILLAKYDFSEIESETTVIDQSEKRMKGTIHNDARIVNLLTEDDEYIKVLDLGNGTGYFDMGRDVGQIMYNLENYTLSTYVYINESYTELNKDGNFIWTFANGNNGDLSYMITPLKEGNQRIEMYPQNWDATQRLIMSGDPIQKGVWKHIAYTQEDGIAGTFYIDGEFWTSGEITHTPKSFLPLEGRSGTIYNWIGRSNWTPDVYLRQAMVYDFRLYSTALSEDDFNTDELINVPATLAKLNNSTVVGLKFPKSKSDDSPYTAYFVGKKLFIDGLEGSEKIELYDITGTRQALVNNQPATINPGIYIVKVNNYAMKVLVK